MVKYYGIKQGFKASLLFCLGRLVAYFLFGSLFGIIGQTLTQGLSIYSIISLFLLGILLVIYGSVTSFGEGITSKIPYCLCRALTGIRSSFILGFVVAVIPCFPFIAVIVRAFAGGSVLFSIVLFASFWFGTSLHLMIIGTMFGKIGESVAQRVRKERVRRVCGFSMIIVGLLFLVEGFMAVFR